MIGYFYLFYIFKNLLRRSVLFIIAFEISLLIRDLISPYCLPFTWRIFILLNVSVQILRKFKNPFSSGEIDWVPNLTLRKFIKVPFKNFI